MYNFFKNKGEGTPGKGQKNAVFQGKTGDKNYKNF